MTIEAKIVCDSVGPNGVRLTTWVLKYPRFIHSEFMTHRVFSRNASSSRAIPFERQMRMIEDDPAMPLEFRKNQKGMQAGEALKEHEQEKAKQLWLFAMDMALTHAKELALLGVHKQYVNRLVEPFAHITVVCTATEWSNFFALRHHHMAQPEIAELARQMWDVYSTTTPKILKAGEWHLPFITNDDMEDYTFDGDIYWDILAKLSIARCARVSYLNHEGKIPSAEEDFLLYDRLLGNQPIHASPAEHQAMARSNLILGQLDDYSSTVFSGNLRGWIQYRKTLESENITEFTGPLE